MVPVGAMTETKALRCAVALAALAHMAEAASASLAAGAMRSLFIWVGALKLLR